MNFSCLGMSTGWRSTILGYLGRRAVDRRHELVGERAVVAISSSVAMIFFHLSAEAGREAIVVGGTAASREPDRVINILFLDVEVKASRQTPHSGLTASANASAWAQRLKK